jgi:Ca-activated chloride channel family protein
MNFLEGFRFYSPQWFLLLPVALWLVWWVRRPQRRPAVIFSSIADLKSLPRTFAQRLRRYLPLLYACGLALLACALARPQTVNSESTVHSEGIAIELAFDISGSMQALDFQLDGEPASRINTVKHVVKEFVNGGHGVAGHPNDLIGVVAFGGYPDSRCPLTLDHGALLDVMKELDTPKVIYDHNHKPLNAETVGQEEMTAIGDGLMLCLDRLQDVEAKSKVVILLSDGGNNAGVILPDDAAKAAKQMGIKVFTIGIGRTGIAPMPVEDAFGHRQLTQVKVELDEECLKSIADITGGKYFNAADTETLANVYNEISKLAKSKIQETQILDFKELYPWLAIPGLALVVLVGLLEATRFRTLP